MKNNRLVYIVTHPITACNLMRGQLKFLKGKGWDVILISSPGKEMQIIHERERITTIPVPIKREIDPIRDFITLIRIYRALRKLRPAIVNASTPKAGFLGMAAAWLARVPVRIYTLRGLRLETKSGISRAVLRTTERIAASCSHKVICVSESLRRLFAGLNPGNKSKMVVLGHGSSNGIDVNRFHSDFLQNEEALKLQELSIPSDARIIGFIGRLTRDKGILELLGAFRILAQTIPNLYLLVVGDFEEGDPVAQECVQEIQQHPRIIKRSFVTDPRPYYPWMDVLVFPSYREGFPNAPLEAAGFGIPTVGFQVTGTVDAVVDGETGKIVRFKDTAALAEAIRAYLTDESLRKQHGAAARERATQLFHPEHLWTTLHEQYLMLTNDPLISKETGISQVQQSGANR